MIRPKTATMEFPAEARTAARIPASACEVVAVFGLKVGFLGFGDAQKHGLLLAGDSLDGIDQLADQVAAALELVIDLGPSLVRFFVDADRLVVAGIDAAASQSDHQEKHEHRSD